MSTPAYRYGEWHGGRDPLEPPFDVAEALDAVGDAVLDGASPQQALRDLLRRGTDGLRGVDDLRRRLAKRQREARQRGRLDGTLEEVRALLEQALAAERAELFPDPGDDARLRELELDTLPDDTARAVEQLREYDWRSPAARDAYEQIDDLLRREVLDSQFAGMKQALQAATPEQMQAVKDMLADLNAMLDADARGQHTQEQFDDFMSKHGQHFPSQPQTLAELVDELARRAAAQQRLMDSLTPQQRQELGELMDGRDGRRPRLADGAAAGQPARVASRPALGGRRADARREGPRGRRGHRRAGGAGRARRAGRRAVAGPAGRRRRGRRAAGAGRGAVDDLAALRRIEQELEAQGYLVRDARGKLEMSPRAVRRLGATALRRVFAQLDAHGRGGHDVRRAGAAGEVTGSSRLWEFGDDQPLDVVRTVRNAVLRTAGTGTWAGGRATKLAVEDVEVVETERRSSAAVALLVDLSYSMEVNGTWGAAKQTALALHSLVTTRFPQDSVQIIGFSDYAQVLRPEELAGLDARHVQGTNLQHALVLAGRHLARHPTPSRSCWWSPTASRRRT
jgi:uncharacterized protein with von Willebrand factor type A (vWA) domain